MEKEWKHDLRLYWKPESALQGKKEGEDRIIQDTGIMKKYNTIGGKKWCEVDSIKTLTSAEGFNK